MIHLLVRHKVADYPKWKAAYDAHAPARQKAGLKETYLLRNVNDPNEVVIFFEGIDLKHAQDFVESIDLRIAMMNAGVTDQPDVYFLA